MKNGFLYVAACVLMSAAAAYIVVDTVLDKRLPATDGADGVTAGVQTQRAASTAAVTSFSDAAEMAVNTVVYVKVTQRAKVSRPSSLLDLFFGFAQTPKDQVGLGSGVIISSDGYIVTNNHVVNGADIIEVTLEDNQSYPARLIGTDAPTDIALLKIDAQDLPCIEMGDSDALRLGDWVLAIGSPYDLRSTITAGIVSAKGRSLPNYDGQYRVESFIQTDAAVNPGNSGGALVNTNGELVGINTSIISLTGSYTGYSFAVPVNIVRKIADDLKQFGSVQRAMLGISMQEIDASMARQLALQQVEGVYVAEVQSGSAAERAGVKPGDVLAEINLNRIKNAASVQEQMSRMRPGEQVALTIIRGNEKIELIVTL